jgi:hypothetical protein
MPSVGIRGVAVPKVSIPAGQKCLKLTLIYLPCRAVLKPKLFTNIDTSEQCS